MKRTIVSAGGEGLKPGQVVYGSLIDANLDVSTEINCVRFDAY